LSLAAIGQGAHPVARQGVEFIVRSVRVDGSWPIDTNLSTWVTTLSINALAAAGDLDKVDQKAELADWLLKQQYQDRHPYTGAEPGGWAWTPLPGGVPDADDSPGALLALSRLKSVIEQGMIRNPPPEPMALPTDVTDTGSAAREILKQYIRWGDLNPVYYGFHDAGFNGCRWLIRLQNKNGGWPTFCRGWGHLPFDRSGSDLTAHVLRALSCWKEAGVQAPMDNSGGDETFVNRLHARVQNGFAYLARQQRPDGSWLPLWFGNQHAPDDINPTYGTARVLAAYRDLDMMNTEAARRGIAWLLANQNDDGGWGGLLGTPSSMEETALAVEVLLDAGPQSETAVNKGLTWLVRQVEVGGLYNPAPIGFYFAKLWYFEKLYPIIFTVAALGKARRRQLPRGPDDGHRSNP
jgi:squalene-hopene/tetraprenyl-beta-curcumene cyclase